ncbi:MAG: hypothetical protein L0228_05405 [Planctomycetes bacterium]|nr:hypothetical protein [Planctomycetota bacterium]
MNLQVDVERVLLAQKSVRAELLAERALGGYWVGHVVSSPLATAAAVSALVAAHHADTKDILRESTADHEQVAERVVQGDLCEFLLESVNWLARHQNSEGGWGDCVEGRSNIAATMLVQAALRLTGIPAKYDDLMLRADQFVAAQGGIAALRRQFRDDKSLLAAVLANCALAGMVPWRQVPALPFEQVCLPKRWQQHVHTAVDRSSLPLLLAVGRAKFHHDPPRNPLTRLLRRSMRAKSLALLERLQAADDSFLASTSTTAFVVLSLASIGCRDHPIVQRGVEFLLSSVRGEACWPVVTNIATSVTTLALNNLASESRWKNAVWEETEVADETVTNDHERGVQHPAQPSAKVHRIDDEDGFTDGCLDWLLDCQRIDQCTLTEVSAGGWSWSDARGALPNTNDTAGALVTLSRWPERESHSRRQRVDRAARLGVTWLLDLQNDDGGWPSFYRRNDGFQPDATGVDVTSHALRALVAWHREWQIDRGQPAASSTSALAERIDAAILRGWQFLESRQRDDGSFVSLWFGNEQQPDDQNPVIGTADVLIACAELQRLDWGLADRAARWLVSSQHAGGGWGPPRAPVDYSSAEKDGFRAWRANEALAKYCTVEETALAVTALLPLATTSQPAAKALSAGLTWLVNAVEQDFHRRPAVVGFYPSRIWYHERLYPLVFAEGALTRVMHLLEVQRPAAAPVG